MATAKTMGGTQGIPALDGWLGAQSAPEPADALEAPRSTGVDDRLNIA